MEPLVKPLFLARLYSCEYLLEQTSFTFLINSRLWTKFLTKILCLFDWGLKKFLVLPFFVLIKLFLFSIQVLHSLPASVIVLQFCWTLQSLRNINRLFYSRLISTCCHVHSAHQIGKRHFGKRKCANNLCFKSHTRFRLEGRIFIAAFCRSLNRLSPHSSMIFCLSALLHWLHCLSLFLAFKAFFMSIWRFSHYCL